MSLLILLASADTASEASASGGLPQLDMSTYPSQIFWLAVTFGFLYWIMSAFVLPQLGGAIEERRDRIADDLDQAADFKRQAEEAEATYNQALADARAKAQAIAAETRADLDAEIAEMQAEATERAEASLAQAEERIASMKADASAKVKDAAEDVTRSIVSALIDETPAEDTVRQAVGKAIGA
ncbi:MAG: ATP F0F1 synthase subunit B [Pseudomonadota bacterium]